MAVWGVVQREVESLGFGFVTGCPGGAHEAGTGVRTKMHRVVDALYRRSSYICRRGIKVESSYGKATENLDTRLKIQHFSIKTPSQRGATSYS